MTTWVINASVAIKWYLPEPDSDPAPGVLRRALDDRILMIAPDLIIPELGNVPWKKHRRGELGMTGARLALDAVRGSFPARIHRSGDLVGAAVEAAVSGGQSVYDCLYTAPAALHRATPVTADRRFAGELAGTDSQPLVIVPGDAAPGP